MPSQFVTLLRNEVTKAARRRLSYFGLFAVGLVCVIIYFIAGQVGNSATTNAWGYVGFSMQLLFNDIGPICIIGFAAKLVADETGAGTIRSALAAPVHRWEFYLAKAVIGLLYMLVLSAFALLFSAALASVHYRFGPVGDSVGVIYSRNQAMREFLVCCALSWIPLSALVMYGLLISTVLRNPAAAVAVGISSLFLINFTKHLVGLDPYIFTRYIDYSWLTLQQIAQGMDYQWRPEVWRMIELSGVSAVLTFAAGLILFVREDLNN
ncbi:MAG: ABC transporter permease [Verrucomicrobiota bacterium]|jgi:ABC-type transport system involved in multi-copper enzyme maturation permease subunit